MMMVKIYYSTQGLSRQGRWMRENRKAGKHDNRKMKACNQKSEADI